MAILSCHVSIKLPPKISDGQNLLFTLSDSLAADAPFPGQIVLAAAVPEELADQAARGVRPSFKLT